jgi:hypothetical protein
MGDHGDMKEGNGDPSLVMFGENVTPNHHKIAREFVLLSNFYVNADVSADGLYWTTAAIAPDTTVKALPTEYADRIYGFSPNAHFNNAIQPQRGKSNPEGVRTAPGATSGIRLSKPVSLFVIMASWRLTCPTSSPTAFRFRKSWILSWRRTRTCIFGSTTGHFRM